MISTIKVDLKDNGLGGVHHRTLRSLGWLNYKTSNGSKPKRCQQQGRVSAQRLEEGDQESTQMGHRGSCRGVCYRQGVHLYRVRE